MRWSVGTPGWLVGRVASAGYVVCVDALDSMGNLDESMDMLENFVDGVVTMPADFPSFHDSCVVAVYDEMLWAVEESLESTE